LIQTIFSPQRVAGFHDIFVALRATGLPMVGSA
jgi:hypothetical protein